MLGCLLGPVFAVLGALWIVFPGWGMWFFLVFEALVILWPLSALGQARAVVASLHQEHSQRLTDDEWTYLRKYALLFLHPLTTRSLSGTISFVTLLSIGIAVGLLIRREWIGIGVCAANYMLLAPLAKFLCPMQFVADGYAKDPLSWGNEKRKLDRCIGFVQSVLKSRAAEADFVDDETES